MSSEIWVQVRFDNGNVGWVNQSATNAFNLPAIPDEEKTGLLTGSGNLGSVIDVVSFTSPYDNTIFANETPSVTNDNIIWVNRSDGGTYHETNGLIFDDTTKTWVIEWDNEKVPAYQDGTYIRDQQGNYYIDICINDDCSETVLVRVEQMSDRGLMNIQIPSDTFSAPNSGAIYTDFVVPLNQNAPNYENDRAQLGAIQAQYSYVSLLISFEILHGRKPTHAELLAIMYAGEVGFEYPDELSNLMQEAVVRGYFDPQSGACRTATDLDGCNYDNFIDYFSNVESFYEQSQIPLGTSYIESEIAGQRSLLREIDINTGNPASYDFMQNQSNLILATIDNIDNRQDIQNTWLSGQGANLPNRWGNIAIRNNDITNESSAKSYIEQQFGVTVFGIVETNKQMNEAKTEIVCYEVFVVTDKGIPVSYCGNN